MRDNRSAFVLNVRFVDGPIRRGVQRGATGLIGALTAVGHYLSFPARCDARDGLDAVQIKGIWASSPSFGVEAEVNELFDETNLKKVGISWQIIANQDSPNCWLVANGALWTGNVY